MKKLLFFVTWLVSLTMNAQQVVNENALPDTHDTLPTHQEKVFRDVEWATVKGFKLTMDIHVPQTGKESYSVLVVYHGGGWLINNKSIMEDMSAYIAQHSEYIVCNVNYRLLVDNNNTTQFNEIIEDAFGALLWIKENISGYKGNPKKVAVTGDSAGGHLASCVVNMGRNLGDAGFTPAHPVFNPTYLPKGMTIKEVLAKDMLKVQAAIINYGAFDIYASCTIGKFETKENIFWMISGAEPRRIFGNDYSAEKNPELYKAVSPVYNLPLVTNYQLPPQLFTVGSNDQLTTPAIITAYVQSVRDAGQSAELWINQGRPHAFMDSGTNAYLGISFNNDAIPAIKIMIAFLNQVLEP